MISLNVAINSYSDSLLSLLISNQFSEIKSTVFKKFERENLFQISCAGKLYFYIFRRSRKVSTEFIFNDNSIKKLGRVVWPIS